MNTGTASELAVPRETLNKSLNLIEVMADDDGAKIGNDSSFLEIPGLVKWRVHRYPDFSLQGHCHGRLGRFMSWGQIKRRRLNQRLSQIKEDIVNIGCFCLTLTEERSDNNGGAPSWFDFLISCYSFQGMMQILSIRTIQEHHYKRPTWKSYLHFRCVYFTQTRFSATQPSMLACRSQICIATRAWSRCGLWLILHRLNRWSRSNINSDVPGWFSLFS